MEKKPLKAWIMLLTLSLIWGSSFILIKKGLNGLTSGEIGALRIFSASIILIPIGARHLKKITPKNFIPLLSVGLTGSLIPSFLFALAQTQISSSVTGVINALTPLFTILIGFLFFKSSLSKKVLFGMFIGFIGTTTLAISSSGEGVLINAYAFLVILATICYGMNLNIIKNYLQDLKSLTITSISLMLVGPMAATYLFFETAFFSNILTDQSVQIATLYITILGVIGTALALLIFNKMVQITDPVFASSVTYIIPLIAVGWGLLDGESVNTAQLIGMIGIIAGVYIANRK